MSFEIIETGVLDAASIMKKDADLLQTLGERKRPILHFYDWDADSLTYGHFVNPKNFLDLEKADKLCLKMAKRPTGGGIVFHIWDFAFSVLIPSSDFRFSQNSLENYAFVNQTVLKAVKKLFDPQGDLELTQKDGLPQDPACLHFCMAKPTQYDVLYQGKKIIGAAQRKTKWGFLHQGTISLMMPNKEILKEVLLPGTKVLDAMFSNTHALLDSMAEKKDLLAARRALREEIEKTFI